MALASRVLGPLRHAKLLARPFRREYVFHGVRRCSKILSASHPRLFSTKTEHLTEPQLYDEAFRKSMENPEEFWAEHAEQLVWAKKWDKVIDNSNPPFTKWFVGGEINTCYNAVDRHVDEGRGDQAAIIHDSPVTDHVCYYSYKELQQMVSDFAGVLSSHGVGHGDRVLIYMPMIPHAVVTMLACARLGAIHSLVFGGFASKELSTRISHAEPKVIVSANCGMDYEKVIPYKPLLDAAIEMSPHKPKACIILNRKYMKFDDAKLLPGRDFDWDEEMNRARPHDCVPVPANDPIYLLYTSGTTGTPKAVVRPNAGHAVTLNWSMYNLYGLKPGETWFAASDLGWVVGHSYIVYAPLLAGNSTVLYEGKPVGTPDAGAFFRIIQDHNVAAMFTAPTALRAIRQQDPDGKLASKYSLPHFRNMFVAGEHCDHETLEWIQKVVDRPILDNWWQTETGSAITCTCVGLGNNLYPPHGVAGRPVPGWNVQVHKEDGTETEDYELGEIVVKLPLPPTSFSTLWKNDDLFKNLYFNIPGYYDTMDAGYRDEHGNIAVLSRADDVINVAGHRLSAGALEEAILEHDDVTEAAVVGLPDQLKGHVPLGFVVLKKGVKESKDECLKKVYQCVREHIGPVAAFKQAVIVDRLPKTRSGKIPRKTLAAMVAGKPYKIPTTIEDPSVYSHVIKDLKDAGLEASRPVE